jgi:hypothetical protein
MTPWALAIVASAQRMENVSKTRVIASVIDRVRIEDSLQ